MGIYFNPDNGSYKQERNSQIFVDKTGLINYLNKRISTEEKCIALSHARRFGKSHAAGMIDVGSSHTSFGYNSSNYRLLTGLHDGQSAHDAATYGKLAAMIGSRPVPTAILVLP